MYRRDYDFEKYGGRLDPDENIFFGPVTLRELKKSMEVADKIIEKRKHKQKQAKVSPIKENCENEDLNETFRISDHETLNTTFEITKSEANLENGALPPTISVAPLKDIGNLTLASTLSNLKLTDSPREIPSYQLAFPETGNLLDDTVLSVIQKNLQTPLIDKIPKQDTKKVVPKQDGKKFFKRISSRKSFKNDITLTNEDPVPITKPQTPRMKTPRIKKFSDTPVTEMVKENCIINSPADFDSSLSKNAKKSSTPEIFSRKRNEVWKKDSPAVKPHAGATYFKSKLPLGRRTPKTYFSAKSPIAAYIHKGEKVQSLSKLRHSSCCIASEEKPNAKSDSKVRLGKIPVYVNTAAKRKLHLDEGKLVQKK